MVGALVNEETEDLRYNLLKYLELVNGEAGYELISLIEPRF